MPKEEEMILSKNTFHFDVEGGKQVLLYSPLTGCMDLIEKDSFLALHSALRHHDDKAVPTASLEYLERRGHVYKTQEDADLARQHGYKEFLEREARSNLRFVILPTYQCNSRCPYCFIGDAIGEESLIAEDTLELAFNAIDTLAARHSSHCTRQLSIFGGEPLIDTPNQRAVIRRILENGSVRNMLIDIVSNGFDLFHYVDLLKEFRVAKVQVTFDGPRSYHNQRRRAVDGKGDSFDRTERGIDAALAADLPLNVRLLLDRNSISMLPELVQHMKEKGCTHIGSVFDCFRCQPGKERAKHLDVLEGNKKLLELCDSDRTLADLLDLDWQGVRRFLYTGKFFPATYKTCFGGTRMFAFDLKGGIYACETTAGRPEYQIGTFAPALKLNEDLMQALQQRNILNIPQCQKCSQALLCAAGCTFNAVVTHGSLLGPGCRMLKETLQFGFDYYWPEIKARIADSASNSRPETAACCGAKNESDRLVGIQTQS
jgi:uncharacterized protein